MTSLKNFASFGTHIAPKLAIIVEQLSVICFVLKFCDESTLRWIFFFFQNEACCHLNKLEPYQRLLYTTFDTKVQALQCAMSILYMNLVEIRYISPSVQQHHKLSSFFLRTCLLGNSRFSNHLENISHVVMIISNLDEEFLGKNFTLLENNCTNCC